MQVNPLSTMVLCVFRILTICVLVIGGFALAHSQSPDHTNILKIGSSFVRSDGPNFFANELDFRVSLTGGERYVVVVFGAGVDTALDIFYEDIHVFKDVFIVDYAGAIISPQVTGQYTMRARGTGFIRDDSIEILDVMPFEVTVEQLHTAPTAVSRLPFSQEAALSDDTRIPYRIAKEYEVLVPEKSRLYAKANSSDFDVLLEIYDEYGRALYSDINSDEDNVEFLSIYTEEEARYFVQVTSFLYGATGLYNLDISSSTGELLTEHLDSVTDADILAFGNYGKRYELPLQAGEYRTIELETYDEQLQLLFTNDELRRLNQLLVVKPNSPGNMTVFAPTTDNYHFFVLKKSGIQANYSVKVYR